MTSGVALIMASFTMPQEIGSDPRFMLWVFPIAAAIAIVYKATKLPKITAAGFFKEAAVLFSSIIVFMAVTALSLYALAWLVTE